EGEGQGGRAATLPLEPHDTGSARAGATLVAATLVPIAAAGPVVGPITALIAIAAVMANGAVGARGGAIDRRGRPHRHVGSPRADHRTWRHVDLARRDDLTPDPAPRSMHPAAIDLDPAPGAPALIGPR